MAEKRFIVELGTGADLHGQDATKAASRAVKDAISRSCLCGLVEVVELRDLNDMRVDVLVAVSMPEQVQADVASGDPVRTEGVARGAGRPAGTWIAPARVGRRIPGRHCGQRRGNGVGKLRGNARSLNTAPLPCAGGLHVGASTLDERR